MLIKKRAAVASAALFLVLALSIVSCSDESSLPNAQDTTTSTPTGAPLSTQSRATPAAAPPARDLLDLARRFRGYPYDGPDVARTTPFDYKPGDQADFTLIDLANTQPYTITATVRRITGHAYFFVQNGSPYTEPALDRITSDFENTVWPMITSAFGEPETPGVDGDPRITILHANLRGAGGYVTASDSYPAAAVSRSAEREMLYLDQDVLSSPGSSYNALVAHELQHLAHEARDINEEAWVNEGMSQVAWEMAGGGSDSVWEFLGKPDTQMNFWPYQQDVSTHYSASELFLSYLLDQYGGRQNGHVLASESGDGIDGVEAYLGSFGKTFDDVFADFVAANVLDAPTGPYGHPEFNGTTTAKKDITAGDTGEDTVSQYGTGYYRVDAGGSFHFDGADDVTIGVPEIDGPYWWSSRGDGIDSRLTRAIDLTAVTSATLTFDVWHDIEPGWDYGYVAVSMDDGRTWTALGGDQTTTDDPIGAAYGPGYTGNSNGWAKDRIDLTPYAGKNLFLRFEYVTDDATHLTGMAIDNVAIPEIGLADTADSTSGWQAEGFRRIDGPLAQKFIVQVISDEGSVTPAALDSLNAGDIPLPDHPVTIAISGATRLTTERASYTWSLNP